MIPIRFFESVALQIERRTKWDLGLASTAVSLRRRCEDHELLSAIRVLLAECPEAAGWFRQRARQIFETPGPDGYAHPNDLALCAYLYLLSADPALESRALIERVTAEAGPEFFASRDLARLLITKG